MSTGVVSFFACGIGLQVGGAAHWLGWGMLFGFVGMAIGVVLRGIAEHQEDKQHGATNPDGWLGYLSDPEPEEPEQHTRYSPKLEAEISHLLRHFEP